jgi:phosphatidylglycerophosphatase GEP4
MFLRVFLLFLEFINAIAISRYSLSQSLNFVGLKSFFSSLSQPQLFIPNENYDRVTMIPLLKLKKRGIQGLIFDKDNTLTAPYTNDLPSDIENFLRRANKVCVEMIIF